MDKNKNKGLADNQEGEFILNESGTSVTVDTGVQYSEDLYDPDKDFKQEDDASKQAEDK